jgi:hypothetical protein
MVCSEVFIRLSHADWLSCMAPVHRISCLFSHLLIRFQLELMSDVAGLLMMSDKCSRSNRDDPIHHCSIRSRAYVISHLSAAAATVSHPISISSTLVNCSNANSRLPPVPSLSVISVQTFPLAMFKPQCSQLQSQLHARIIESCRGLT